MDALTFASEAVRIADEIVKAHKAKDAERVKALGEESKALIAKRAETRLKEEGFNKKQG